MATYISQNINDTKIKIRWQETYVSEGLNKKLGNILPRGIYFGFNPVVVGQNVTLQVESGVGSIAVYNNKSNGISISIHESNDITLDFSSVPNGTSGFIVIRVNYLVGSPTVGQYLVIDTADLQVNDIVVCQFSKDAGGVITVNTTPGINRTLPDGSDPNSLPYVFVPKNHRFSNPIDHADGSIPAVKLDDPQTPFPELIFGSGKRLRGEYDASAVADDDKCQAKWGDGAQGYARILQDKQDFWLTKNARWDGNKFYLDNPNLYAYRISIFNSHTTDEGVSFWFALPGSGPRQWYRMFWYRPDPSQNGVQELLVGMDRNGVQAQKLRIIKSNGSGYADVAVRNLIIIDESTGSELRLKYLGSGLLAGEIPADSCIHRKTEILVRNNKYIFCSLSFEYLHEPNVIISLSQAISDGEYVYAFSMKNDLNVAVYYYFLYRIFRFDIF